MMTAVMPLNLEALRKQPPLQRWRTLRTACWLNSIAAAAGETNPSAIERKLSEVSFGKDGQRERSRIIEKYLSGKVAPSTRRNGLILKAEKRYQGTQRWWELPLWYILDPRINSPESLLMGIRKLPPAASESLVDISGSDLYQIIKPKLCDEHTINALLNPLDLPDQIAILIALSASERFGWANSVEGLYAMIARRIGLLADTHAPLGAVGVGISQFLLDLKLVPIPEKTFYLLMQDPNTLIRPTDRFIASLAWGKRIPRC